MKLIDKFLKKLNTSRNTFFTYILTLFSIYFAVDRIVEMAFMIFTGVSVDYWGPIKYTIALACPVFAFFLSGPSEFAKTKDIKVSLFYTYCVGLYIIAVSMIVQWGNMLAWLAFISVPNYAEIITEFSDLVKPAFTTASLYLPLVTIFPLIKWIILGVDDSKDMKRSIWDYPGINISDTKANHGPYTCDLYLGFDKLSGKDIIISENNRFLSLFVCGPSGSGKTSLVFEPSMARDIERKYFFKEVSKELGFAALRTGIATLNCPYDNEYLNKYFTLNMIKPVEEKKNLYKSYVKKMILGEGYDGLIYKNVGITSISPDYESTSRVIAVAKNFNIPYNIVDPSNPDSIGLNPFIYDDPNKIAVTISSALKEMYNLKHEETQEAFKEDVTTQALENIAILLKEMYPRLHEGLLPNLEDMLKMLTNFDLVEKTCEILKHDEELAEKYAIQIAYFQNNFYKDGVGRADTQKYVYAAVSQLDNLLRYPGVKSILCNRTRNINFDKALANGEVTFLCTRRGDLGAVAHKAFGLFFILSMQNAILRRPGNEKTRVPHYLYIDEFPDFICKATDAIFTLYRKYRVGTTICAQNLKQLETPLSINEYRQTILSNCANKIVFGNNTPEDNEWWAVEMGEKREWKYSVSMDMNKLEYDSKYGSVTWAWIKNFEASKIQSLTFKYCIYKVKNDAGKNIVGEGKLDFIPSKCKEQHTSRNYDFIKYSKAPIQHSKIVENAKIKKDTTNTEETDPIVMN